LESNDNPVAACNFGPNFSSKTDMILRDNFMRAMRFLFCLAAGTLLAAPASLLAQATNAPTQTSRPPSRSLVPNGFNGAQGGGMAGYALGGPVGVLTDQQRASYETIMNGQRARLADLQNKLRTARQDLLVTSLDQKFDETIIRQKALIVAKIDAEMIVVRIKVFSQVQPPLTADQIEKIKAGQPGQLRPLPRGAPHQTPAGTNHDDSGLPPKK
jgi:Spy/CpxP family protein refolding chaperone